MSSSDPTAGPSDDPSGGSDDVEEQPEQVDQGGQSDVETEQHDQQEDQGGQSDVVAEQHDQQEDQGGQSDVVAEQHDQQEDQGGQSDVEKEQVQNVDQGGQPDIVKEGGAAAPLAFAGVGAGIAAAGMGASVISATIICLDPTLPLPPIEFNFNPSAYQQTFEGKWSGDRLQPAGNGPPPQWLGVKPSSVSVPLLLDTFSVPPCPPQPTLEILKMLMVPTPTSVTVTRIPAAPKVMFMWGPNIILEEAYVTRVDVKYERFLLGIPVRVTATVTMVSVPPPFPMPPTNPTSGGLASPRTRTVVEGDSLASIAYQEYRDPNQWRAIAEANKIDDPMRLKAGRVLVVPDRSEAENLS